MNPFRKIKEALQRKKEDRLVRERTVDWQHFYIVDHLVYDKPDAFTSTPLYRPYESKDFQDVIEHGTRLLDEVNLGPDATEVLDLQPRFRELFLKAELVETRVLHQWNALHNKSDVASQLTKRQVDRRKAEKHLNELVAERTALNAKALSGQKGESENE